MRLVSSLIFVALIMVSAWGQRAGSYCSAASGNRNAASTWEIYNDSSWVAASATPIYINSVITIQSGHTVTFAARILLFAR
ncbi:MAG: hypothetical protein M1303_06830 [Bacteroidetes bacterium]|nr:hypothetical protein [Bacteroidota bacterium]